MLQFLHDRLDRCPIRGSSRIRTFTAITAIDTGGSMLKLLNMFVMGVIAGNQPPQLLELGGPSQE